MGKDAEAWVDQHKSTSLRKQLAGNDWLQKLYVEKTHLHEKYIQPQFGLGGTCAWKKGLADEWRY
jgi:hypothetical protein